MSVLLMSKCTLYYKPFLLAEGGLGSHLTSCHLTAQDIFGGFKDSGPVLEGGVGHTSALAIGHQI